MLGNSASGAKNGLDVGAEAFAEGEETSSVGPEVGDSASLGCLPCGLVDEDSIGGTCGKKRNVERGQTASEGGKDEGSVRSSVEWSFRPPGEIFS